MSEPAPQTYHALIKTFTAFLTVAIHTILYERQLYPRASFLSARKYNCAVRQNRHPLVCRWVTDAVEAVEGEMVKGTVSQTSLIIHSPASKPLERFIFSTASFPILPPNTHLTPFSPPPTTTTTTTETAPPPIDLTEQFRAIFTRLATISSRLAPLPPDCSFTVAIELREAAEKPIGHPQPWVPSQMGLQSGDGEGRGEDLGGVRTTPVRRVEAGEFVMEMWVEEGRGKVGVEVGGD